MAEPAPEIQVLSRANYEDQKIITLPNALPLPALGASSLRIKTTIISLTTNNLSYARIGHLLSWWDLHPLPASIPKEFSDPRKYGRISGWGIGTVIESTVPEIQTGTQLYGYLPIGTLPVDVEVEIDPTIDGQFVVTSAHRQHVLPVYNRYIYYPPIPSSKSQQQSQGYDSLMQVLFETGWMMNRFVFAWDPKEHANPDGDVNGKWTYEKGIIDYKTIVIIFAASGKTALSFAYNLKHGRPASSTPRMIVGVGSEGSQLFTEDSGLFDKVLTYDADKGDLSLELDLHPDSKVIVCDFGARESASDRWAAKLRQGEHNIEELAIGGECVPYTPEEATANYISRMKAGAGAKFQVNASAVRSLGFENITKEKYFEDFLKDWNSFKAQGGIKGIELVWGKGMGDLGKAWDRLCKGDVGPTQGLLFDLSEDS